MTMLMEETDLARTVLDHRFSGIFPGRPETVADARHAVAGFLGGHPLAGDVTLIVSELATNAVLHSAEGSFVVRVETWPGYILVEVQDQGGPWVARQRDGRPHGLDVVEALTDGWGTETITSGDRVVWARVNTADASFSVASTQASSGKEET